MILNIFNGEVEIDWEDAEKVIKEELNKLSKEELIQFILDNDCTEYDLEEEFREQITVYYASDCWED